MIYFAFPFLVDLSLYTSETQLERASSNELSTPKSSKKPIAATTKKSTVKKSLKRARAQSDEEDDDDSDYVVLAKTVKTSVNQPAREVSESKIVNRPRRSF